MDSDSSVEQRRATQQKRRPPGEVVRVTARFDSDGVLQEDLTSAPAEVMIEATDSEGEVAVWFDDYWWTDLIERWVDDPITLHITQTPGALLHPVVLHQMEMVGRVAPRWRMVGHSYRSDVSTDDAIESLACSAYHEVRFLDQTRPGAPRSDREGLDLSVDELFGRIRREQVRLGATRPVLVRLPAQSPVGVKEPSPGVCERDTSTLPA
ncbi:MAG: hypothetical protein JSU63_05380 [Phycisphaerales bacterium]|nr:MAG: hypothetical protein JSU63_05380 [Phycisphaerales bacterium]